MSIRPARRHKKPKYHARLMRRKRARRTPRQRQLDRIKSWIRWFTLNPVTMHRLPGYRASRYRRYLYTRAYDNFTCVVGTSGEFAIKVLLVKAAPRRPISYAMRDLLDERGEPPSHFASDREWILAHLPRDLSLVETSSRKKRVRSTQELYR